MELRIDVELQGELLLVIAKGRASSAAVSRHLRQVFDTAAENRVDKILIDALAVDGELAAFERYRIGAEIAAYLDERQIEVKVAFVGVPPTMNGFGLRVARNRGVITDMFSTRQEALRWLIEPRMEHPVQPEAEFD